MVLNVIALKPDESFLKFLDYDLIQIKETNEVNGLRTIDVEYTFQDFQKDKELFQLGNKLWINGDEHLTDCLYIINTKVKEDVFNKNVITFTAEEVLVELNYAPLFHHLDLSKSNFHTITTNDVQEVYVDYNALDYWFGDYYNIGVVQEPINNNYGKRISINGTITRMALLRQIEEETGNVFITRYEKDVLNNTIHRYLDFLNPINVDRNWELHLTYNFLNQDSITPIDHEGNPTIEDKPWEVTRYDTGVTAESVPETVYPASDVPDDQGTEIGSTYDAKDDKLDPSKDYTPYVNITPSDCTLRLVDDDTVLYEWDAADMGLEDNGQETVISLSKQGIYLGLDVNDKSFAVVTDNDVSKQKGYLSVIKTDGHITIDNEDSYEGVIPDDCMFEIYDSTHDTVLFRTTLNTIIGEVHTDVLDFGFNLENVEYNIDETDTYTAVTPILDYNSFNGLPNYRFDNLIQRWLNLKISKGETIPMIVQSINVQESSLEAAKVSLGSYDELSGKSESKSRSNWWRRPYVPQDSIDSNTPANNKWQFHRATAYWTAPYTKNAGELHVSTDKRYETSYQQIHEKTDSRNERTQNSDKMGTTSSSNEDVFMIYNAVVNYLREHETPKVDVDVDVVELKDGRYNDYQIWDKVYLKLPDSNDLITARVTKTTKESHDISKNTLSLNNYTAVNTLKTIQNKTVISAQNTSFKYPNSKTVSARLENLNYDNTNPYSVQYPVNKLVTFSLSIVENGQTTPTRNVWKRRTNENGYAKLALKLDPGNYVLDISFSGDEEYEESSISIKVNVGGVKEEPKTTETETQNKVTQETTKEVTKTTYYDKYGRSPDKTKILAIGLPSASADSGGYTFTETEFKNHCPHCGKSELYWGIFWAGNEHSNWGKFPATGRQEGGSAEGHIFCKHCDADYSCQGNEHISGGKKLTVTKKRKSSTKAKAYELRNGKRVYNKKTTKVTETTSKNNKTRKIKASDLSSKVKKQALAIVGDATGISAAKKVAAWMDDNIDYSGYANFVRSPDSVMKKGSGNCCDQTRLFLQLCDAAGCTEYMTLKYRHVYNHVYALVIPHKSKKTITVDCASDSYGAWGYVCQNYRTAALRETVYPNRPF